MMNFDGSQDSVVDARARARSRVPQRRARAAHADAAPAADGARRDRVDLLRDAAVRARRARARPTTRERLALLDVHLVGATQTVVDIHSRFLFETELCARRRRTALSVADLKTAMLDAQEAAYGDGLAPRVPPRVHVGGQGPLLHAVLQLAVHVRACCSASGCTRATSTIPSAFRAGYDDLLSAVGMADAAALAGAVRLRRPRRRRSGPRASRCSRRHIDDYERLAAEALAQ